MRKASFADLLGSEPLTSGRHRSPVAESETGGPHGEGPVTLTVAPGHVIDHGGFRVYEEPGFRTHNEPGPHRHTFPEVFCIYQGHGTVEVDGAEVDAFTAGDVIVFEPGEDHHLISRGDGPLVFAWMHLRPQP